MKIITARNWARMQAILAAREQADAARDTQRLATIKVLEARMLAITTRFASIPTNMQADNHHQAIKMLGRLLQLATGHQHRMAVGLSVNVAKASARNKSCPCGSDKKYKACCMRSHTNGG